MFSLGDGTKFWLYSKPTDMRENFNMLSGIVNNHVGQNLYSGDVFVFVNSALVQLAGSLLWQPYSLMPAQRMERRLGLKSAPRTSSWLVIVIGPNLSTGDPPGAACFLQEFPYFWLCENCLS